MDLTLFIIILIFCLLIYYLINTIVSLQLEIRDIKNKCITVNNLNKTDLVKDTPIINDDITEKTLLLLQKIKNIYI